MKTFLYTAILIFSFVSCGTKKTKKVMSISKEIEITGTAYDRKGGAVVATDSIHYWIENKNFWENEFLNKKVIIKGTLVKRNDNPVFLDTSEIKSQGIPVYSKEQLEAQKGRFWIKNAKVNLAD